jgi:hypothetical protein
MVSSDCIAVRTDSDEDYLCLSNENSAEPSFCLSETLFELAPSWLVTERCAGNNASTSSASSSNECLAWLCARFEQIMTSVNGRFKLQAPVNNPPTVQRCVAPSPSPLPSMPPLNVLPIAIGVVLGAIVVAALVVVLCVVARRRKANVSDRIVCMRN